MAVATTSIVGFGLSAALATSAHVKEKKRQKELDNLEIPELDNAFEDIQISTLGSDLIKEENQIATSSAIDAYRSGGTRSVMAGVPQIVAFNNQANQEAGKYLDDQIINRDYNIAQDNQRTRGMVENRYLGEVQGLNNAIQGENQNVWSGLRGVGNSIAFAQRSGVFGEEAQDAVTF